MLATLASEVKQIYDCTIFDIFIGNEYLPVAIVEAEVIRKQVADETAGAEGGNARRVNLSMLVEYHLMNPS